MLNLKNTNTAVVHLRGIIKGTSMVTRCVADKIEVMTEDITVRMMIASAEIIVAF